jgi:uncharacterized protein YidB (DUF937 family)
MGLFDEVVSMTGLGGSQSQGGVLAGVMEYVNSPQVGGISGLQRMFQEKGLEGVISSWVGTGQNLPISPEQVQSVLHSDALEQIAAKAGINPSQVASMLSTHLPNIIDKLTPNGQVPDASSLTQMLKGLAAGQQ